MSKNPKAFETRVKPYLNSTRKAGLCKKKKYNKSVALPLCVAFQWICLIIITKVPFWWVFAQNNCFTWLYFSFSDSKWNGLSFTNYNTFQKFGVNKMTLIWKKSILLFSKDAFNLIKNSSKNISHKRFLLHINTEKLNASQLCCLTFVKTVFNICNDNKCFFVSISARYLKDHVTLE